MPEEQDTLHIIGMPVTFDTDLTVPGSKKYPCSQCHEDCWIAPEGQKLTDQGTVVEIWCAHCYYTKYPEAEMEIPDEVLERLSQLVGRPVTREEALKNARAARAQFLEEAKGEADADLATE